MAKKRSKSKSSKVEKSQKPADKPAEKATFKVSVKGAYARSREYIYRYKLAHPRPHKAFRRSYREDHVRPLEMPGLLHHAMRCMRVIFANWRVFLPLLIGAVIINALLVGLMNEATYVTLQDTLDETNESLSSGQIGQVAKAGLLLMSTITSGGLQGGLSEVQVVFAILIFVVVWLTTIWLVRQIRAGNKPRLRDGLYNSMAPFVSTLIVLVALFIFLIPIFILIITYSAAATTGFLSTPFYAFCFFLFASLLITLSVYLVPGAITALVASTTPGIYPLTAINLCFDLLVGRRIRFIWRVIFLIFFLCIIAVVFMLPLILLDMWLKANFDIFAGIPIIPTLLAFITVFAFTYVSVYFYTLYRSLLDDQN